MHLQKKALLLKKLGLKKKRKGLDLRKWADKGMCTNVGKSKRWGESGYLRYHGSLTFKDRVLNKNN